MSKSCPISQIQVSETVVRLNALWTVLSLIGIYFYPWIVSLLIVDFFIRGFWNPRNSLFSKFSCLVVKILKLKSKTTNGGPKIFAAKIGFLMSSIILFCFLFALTIPFYVFWIMIMVCACLEAFLGYCVGCQLYSILGSVFKWR